MNEFGFWERWGIELNDKQFANAFTAIGIIAGQSERFSGADASKKHTTRDKNIRQKLPINVVTAALSELLTGTRNKEIFIRWKYPQHGLPVKIAEQITLLSYLDSKILAQSWEKVCHDTNLYPRFRVIDHPTSELIRPWFRLLFEAAPENKAAHIELTAAQSTLHLKWPLRLGFLPGNAAEESVRSARFYWPSNELTSTVRIDRENANCDVLLFTGSSGQLLKTLLETPVPQKTNLFIVRGTFEDDLAATGQRLSAIAAEGRASGFVLLNPPVTDEVLGRAVNRFVENLSHNQTVDVAVSEAFTKSYPADPVIFLSRDLATFQLEHVLEKIHSRLISLPKAARPQIESDCFLRMGIPADSAKDDLTIPENAARRLKEFKSTVRFDAESSGALGIAKMSKAIDLTESQIIEEKQQQRFLQEQIFIKKEGKFVEERRAFLKGVPTLIRVRIGPPDEKWPAIDIVFPEEKLPKDLDEWRLTVVLTEANHLKEALRKSIKLPRAGPSTECEFRVQPGEHAIFEGRITVLHRGRILQTAVLKGRVVGDEREITNDDKISFTDILPVRAHIGDLEGRRQFDLAFVMNHTIDQRPLLTAIAANHAWLADISACQDITRDINSELTKVAESVKDYSGGLISGENVELLVKLAQIGRQLYGKIVLGQLKQPGNQASFEKIEYIQIVSTKAEAMMPLEFIYPPVAPKNNAKLCPSMATVVEEPDKNTRMCNAKALIERICQAVDEGKKECEYRTTEYVCPMGFWGISKVIERHTPTPLLAQPGKDFFLQSVEVTTARAELQITGTAIVAASEKVTQKMLSPVLSVCTERLGSPPQEAKDWSDWVKLIKTYKPHILVALPHTDGSGKNATLEINGKTLSSGQITEDYVHPSDEETYPLVALLGCDTTGTALDYGEYVSWFRWQGAALVISTIAKVFGGHAAAVAGQLVEGLKQITGQQERIGEIIRAIKRQALLDGSLMALCIVAFGDADWKLN
jgi:hypothetical protein